MGCGKMSHLGCGAGACLRQYAAFTGGGVRRTIGSGLRSRRIALRNPPSRHLRNPASGERNLHSAVCADLYCTAPVTVAFPGKFACPGLVAPVLPRQDSRPGGYPLVPGCSTTMTPSTAKISAATPWISGNGSILVMRSPNSTAGTLAIIMPSVVPATTA